MKAIQELEKAEAKSEKEATPNKVAATRSADEDELAMDVEDEAFEEENDYTASYWEDNDEDFDDGDDGGDGGT